MLSDTELEIIKNYGRLSYENGYKDGYNKGIIIGCIGTLTSWLLLELFKNNLKNRLYL
jgi:hypothetical protein